METEKRLIDVDARIAELRKKYCTGCDNHNGVRCGTCLVENAIGLFEDVPTVDAKPVVHGQWENVTGGMIKLGNCSICKVRQCVIGTNYCINCGAKMDGENDGEIH